MEELVELMQRLLEIQSGGRQRSPELVAEDERLMDGLQKRYLAGKPPQRVERSPLQPKPPQKGARLLAFSPHIAGRICESHRMQDP
jgi:hypothetical protein